MSIELNNLSLLIDLRNAFKSELTNDDYKEECAYPFSITTSRFLLLTFASSISFLGIITNALLFCIFLKNFSHEAYLTLLSLFDFLRCLIYILLIQVEASAFYLKSKFLYDLFFTYNIPCLILGQIIQFYVQVLLILKAFQRWSLVTKRKDGYWRLVHDSPGPEALCSVSFCFVFLVKIPSFWAFQIKTYPSCSNYFLTKELWSTSVAFYQWYPIYDKLITCMQIFVPLLTLSILHGAVIIKLRSKKRSNARRSSERKRRCQMGGNLIELANLIALKKQANVINLLAEEERNVSKSSGIIILSQLICILFLSVLTIVKNWIPNGIADQGRGWFSIYTLARDVCSFMFILSSAIRVVIYYRYDSRIHNEIERKFCSHVTKRSHNSSTNTLLPEFVLDNVAL